MIGMRARFGIGAATAALAVTAVAGCSGSGGGGGATGLGGSGAATTGGGNPAELSLVADAMNKASAAGTVKITGTMTAPGVGAPMTMTAQEQNSPTFEMSMSTQIEGRAMSEILVGDVFYMDYSALSPELDGKQWAEIDLSKVTSLGSLSSLLNSARNENPTTQIAALVASGTVTKVGTESVNGQSTTHYAGTLNASQLLKAGTASSNLSAAQLSQLKSELQSAGVSTVKIDLWVASTGLPVEEKYSEQTAAGTATGDLFMSDWGSPVTIGAPPASQVYNLTSALESAQAGATATASAG